MPGGTRIATLSVEVVGLYIWKRLEAMGLQVPCPLALDLLLPAKR